MKIKFRKPKPEKPSEVPDLHLTATINDKGQPHDNKQVILTYYLKENKLIISGVPKEMFAYIVQMHESIIDHYSGVDVQTEILFKKLNVVLKLEQLELKDLVK
jgi:hypothetical protein